MDAHYLRKDKCGRRIKDRIMKEYVEDDSSRQEPNVPLLNLKTPRAIIPDLPDDQFKYSDLFRKAQQVNQSARQSLGRWCNTDRQHSSTHQLHQLHTSPSSFFRRQPTQPVQQSPNASLEKTLLDKYHECKALKGALDKMRVEYQQRLAEANQNIAMLLEEVKGLTRLNVLLDGKIREGILEVNESRFDDELGVRISRLREMKREERASADSIAKMIKKLKTGKTLEDRNQSPRKNETFMGSAKSIRQVSIQTDQQPQLPHLIRENQWLQQLCRQKDLTNQNLQQQLNKLKSLTQSQPSLKTKSSKMTTTTGHSENDQSMVQTSAQVRIKQLQMENDHLRMHKAELMHIEMKMQKEKSVRSSSQQTPTISPRTASTLTHKTSFSSSKLQLENEAFRNEINLLMHSNNILAREYNKLVEAGGEIAEMNHIMNQKIQEMDSQMQLAKRLIMIKEGMIDDLREQLASEMRSKKSELSFSVKSYGKSFELSDQLE